MPNRRELKRRRTTVPNVLRQRELQSGTLTAWCISQSDGPECNASAKTRQTRSVN